MQSRIFLYYLNFGFLLQDISMVCLLEGYRNDLLTFIDELLRELGRLSHQATQSSLILFPCACIFEEIVKLFEKKVKDISLFPMKSRRIQIRNCSF